MFSILINEKGGEQKRLEFDKPEVTIGRVAGNDIILPKGNVSKRHSRIVLKDGKFIIVDLKSTNGTYVNGRKINSPLVVKATDKIYIGDFILAIDEAGGVGESTGGDETAPPPVEAPSSASAQSAPSRAAPPPPPRPTRGPTAPPPPSPRDEVSPEIAAGSEDAEEAPARPGRPAPPARATMMNEVIARPTVANEIIREPAPRPPEPSAAPRPTASLAALDRPVVATDRISDRATMMGGEAPARPAATPMAPIQVTPPVSVNVVPVQVAPAQAPAAPAPVQAPAPVAAPAVTRPAPTRPAPAPAPRTRAPQPTRSSLGAVQANIDDPQRRRRVDLLTQVANRVNDAIGFLSLSAEQLAEPGLPARVEAAVRDAVDKMTPLPIGFDVETLAKEAIAELNGAGPLDDLLADETIHEVAVTNHDRIYVDKGSGQALSDRVFSSAAAVLRAVDRLASRAGQRVEGNISELRLDGSLLQVALPPNARVPSLVLRRSRRTGGRLQDLVNQGVLSAAMSEFLELCMRERRNLVVSGYGRVVMMGALGGATGVGARVISVEPVSELDLTGSSAAWIGLIGRGADTRSIIAHAVRMHPDHLIITDVRGPEALDVAAALCGGQGVVVGVDAASGRDAIARLESLARLSGESPPRKALREELAAGAHLSVHVGRTASGAYRVMEISEVTLAEEGGVELLTIFSFKPEGGDGQFVATGHVPAFAG